MRSLQLSVRTRTHGVLQKLSDPLESITLKNKDKTTVTIADGDEKEKLLRLVKTVKEIDPDFIFTDGGDSFIMPYLAHRAFANGVLNDFILSRDHIPLETSKSQGQTFFWIRTEIREQEERERKKNRKLVLFT